MAVSAISSGRECLAWDIAGETGPVVRKKILNIEGTGGIHSASSLTGRNKKQEI